MTTPVLAPVSAAFATVRYYTAADPYFYTIDNRPLTDMSGNDGALASGTDAARRAVLIDSLFRAVTLENRYGQTRYIDGLLASNPGANTVRIGVGSVYEYLNITTSDARNVLKQGASMYFKDFLINTVSLTGGQSAIYAIEGRYTDFSATTPVAVPVYDATNTQLPSTMMFGELQLQVTPGVAATTGSEVAPGVTSGWFHLYWVTVNGAAPTTFSKVQYPTSPTFNSWGLTAERVALFNLASGGSTSSTVDDMPTTHFADAATQSAIGSAVLTLGSPIVIGFNPYKPFKVRINHTPSVSANNFMVKVSYAYIRPTTAVGTTSYTALTQEAIAAGTADQYQTVVLTNTVPALTTLDVTNVDYNQLRIKFQRIGADGGDTNTGILRVLNQQIQVFQ